MSKESHNFIHDHDHEDSRNSYNDILFSFVLNFSLAVIELLAFFFTNSITMYSNSLHDFGDSIILFFTSRIERVSNKKRSRKYTYGNRRFSLVGALFNVVVLLISSIFIIYTSINRLFHPEEIEVNIVIVVAILGIIVNFVAMKKMMNDDSLVNKALVLNFRADLLNYIAILISAILILVFDIVFIDSLFSIFIAIKMLIEIYKEMHEIFEMLMQAVPRNIDIDEVEEFIRQKDFVKDVHDIHIWNLDGRDYIMSFHIVVDHNMYSNEELMDLKESLKLELENMNINHTTIEIDTIDYATRLENRYEHNTSYNK